MRPEVLLLDEPTAGLDADGVVRLMAALESWPPWGRRWCYPPTMSIWPMPGQRMSPFSDGRTVAQGRVAEVLGNVDAWRKPLQAPMILELARAMRIAQAVARTRGDMIGSDAGETVSINIGSLGRGDEAWSFALFRPNAETLGP